MKKILLFLLSLLVILLIAGCLPQERDLDIPEELRPPEEALAGQAVFGQLTVRQLNDGIVLGLRDTVRWPADMPANMLELPVEVAFRSIQGNRVIYIYSYTDSKYYFPEGSVNFGLTPSYKMRGLIFDTVRPNHQYYIVSTVEGSLLQLPTEQAVEDSGQAVEDFELTLTTNGRCDREGHGEDIDGKSHVCQMSDEGGLRWKRIVREYCDDSVQCKRGLVCGSGFHRSLVHAEELAYYGVSPVCLGTEGSDCSRSLDCLDGMGISGLRCEGDLLTGRRTCVVPPRTNGRCSRAGDPLNINGIPHMCENVAGENVAPQLEWRRAVNQICDNTAQCLLRTSCGIGDRGDARCLGQENYYCSGDSYSCLSNYKCGPDQRCAACLPVELAPDGRCVRCPRVNMYNFRVPAQWNPIGGLTGSGAHVFAVNIADEIQLPAQPVSSLLADRFTFAFWYNPGAVADRPTFGFDNRRERSPFSLVRGPFVSYDGGLSFGDDRQSLVAVATNQLLDPLPLALVNRWTHYAIVDDGINYIVYVNGKELFRRLILVNPGSDVNKAFRMGDSGFRNEAGAFNGKIDESFIFDFGLSGKQISDLYNRRWKSSNRLVEWDGCVKPVG